MANLISVLRKHARRLPHEIAYLFLEDGKNKTAHITYSELDVKARAIASYLQDKRIMGERVLLLYPPGIDFICAYLGCLYAGVIAVPVNCPRLSEFKKSEAWLNAIAVNADIVGIFTTSPYLTKTKECFKETLLPNSKLFATDTTCIDDDISVMYRDIEINSEQIAYLQYSSGSTALPKAAIIQHKQLNHSLKYNADVWKYSKKSTSLTWASHAHVYGLVCGLLVPLYAGAKAIIIPSDAFLQKPICWLEAITKYRVTHSGCPNFGYDLCIQEISDFALGHLDLKSWKVAVNGGEKVQYETLIKFCQKFATQGFKINQFCSAYGSSELTGTIAVSQFAKNPTVLSLNIEALNNDNVVIEKTNLPHLSFVGSGRVIGGLEVIVVDPNTFVPVVDGKIGELWLSGKSVANGYWNNVEETKKSFNARLHRSTKLYFRTGDLGFIKNKEIFLTGRLKDIIVLHGKKYYPADLELSVTSALESLPVGYRHVAFSAMVSGKEEVVFLQEVKKDITAAEQDKINKIIPHSIMKEYGINVHDVILVDENTLPKTSSGKLQRNLCKQKYLDKQLDTIYNYVNTLSNQAKQKIDSFDKTNFVALVSSVLKINADQLDLNAPLSNYKLDSIKIVQLTGILNDTYPISFNPADIFEYATFGEFFENVILKDQNTDKKAISIKNKSSEDIAIIGMAGAFPGANNLDEFWNNLISGKDNISEIPNERWNWQESNIKWGGFINDIASFDAEFFNISPREAELTDPQQRIFIQTAWNAIEDAGYSTIELAKLKTGLFVGVFNNDYAELLQKEGISDAYITTGTTHSILANRVSYLFNFTGPSEAIDTACSSSLVALHHAVKAIHNSDCEVAIVGGVNALLSPSPYLAASKAGMLSEDGRCKTFDKRANGYVRSEGVAAIVIKPLNRAKADGDYIYGVIKGTAINHGGHVSSLTVPNPNAQADVIIAACQRANIEIDSINYIETHGTGTSLGDPIEINGLKKAFKELAQEQGKNNLAIHYCGLGSLKTNIGHLEAAAGIAGVIKVLLALKHKKIPGNIHFQELNPYIELNATPFYIIDKTQPWVKVNDNPLRAGVSSFGFGGTNAHVIIEEFSNEDTTQQDIPCLIVLSAKTEAALTQRIADLYDWLKKQEVKLALTAISYTLCIGRNHFSKRFMLVVDSILELQRSLGELIDNKYVSLIEKIHTNNTIANAHYKNELLLLGKKYLDGVDIEWSKINFGEKRRIAVPTYPFAKDLYWIPQRTKSSKQLNETTQPEPINNNTDVLIQGKNDIANYVSEILKINIANINFTQSLADLGFDSISFKELSVSLEKHFKVEVNPTLFFTHNSVESISQYFVKTHAELLNGQYHRDVIANDIAVKQTSTSDHFQMNNVKTTDDVAIIGIHGYFPHSYDLNEFWQHLEAGHDFVDEVPIERWNWREFYGDSKIDLNKSNSKWGACLSDVDKFDAAFFNISAREANLMDPQQRLLMEVIWKTIEDAGYDPSAFSGKNVGLFAGVEFNDYQNLMQKNLHSLPGHLATGTSHAMIANRISYFLNLTGPSEVIDTACSSSLVAIHHAVNSIRQGECTMAIASGVSLMLNPETLVITSQLGVLSPDGRCKTFDKSANGYVKGEGVAAILLKNADQAKRDGDFIYGFIKGSAVNHGGKAQSLTAPNAATQSQLIINAFKQANIDPKTISYIETHGTGTELGDPIEIEGLKLAFNTLLSSKAENPYCGLGSVKTNIGHLEPASGIAGVIKVLLAMQHAKMPGILHFNELNPYIDLANSPFYIVNQLKNWERIKDNGIEIPRRAGISSFGFGGTCAHVIIEENPFNSINSEQQNKPYYLITLSAKNDDVLNQKIIELYKWAQNNNKVSLESLSYTLNIGRTHFNKRCAIVVNSFAELLNSLQLIIESRPTMNYIRGEEKEFLMNYSPLFSEIYKYSMNVLVDYKNQSADSYRDKLLLIADLYVKNYQIDWNLLHNDEKHMRVSMLPTYPFAKQRYWFDVEESKPLLITENNVQVDTPKNLQDFGIHYLKNIFAEKLRISSQDISVNATYEAYGIDSLIGLEITNRIQQDFSALPKTILYEKNTLSDLADFLNKKYKPILENLSGKNFQDIKSSESNVEKNITSSRTIISNEDDPIAIIGLSGVFPQSNNMDEFWNNLINSQNCISEVPKDRWDYKDNPVKVGNENKYFKFGGFIADVDKFDPLFFGIAPREAMLMDPQERLFLQNAWTTLEDAGYTRNKLKNKVNNNVGVFVGVTYNFYPLLIADEWAKGNRLPLDIQMFSVANRVSYHFNLTGPSYIIDTACSSSLSAIHLACESILRGECLMAIAGGVNLSIHPAKYHFLGGYGFMSDEGKCASFAEGGSGYVPGEGVGSLLLKRLSHAIEDNDRIYGIIKSSSMNHGGKTSGYTVPNPNAQAELIKDALAKSQINPRSISYIEAHGTGTSLGDPIEIRGLQEAFEEYTQEKQFCAIGSVKSNIGHLESAAGVSQIAKVLLQIKHKKLVPSIHSEKLNPFIEFEKTPFYVQHELQDWIPKNNLRRAGISSFGAGGTNVHLIIEEYIQSSQNTSISNDNNFIFLLSAMNKERLHEYVKDWITFFERHQTQFASAEEKNKWLDEICYTSQVGREPMSSRLAILGDSLDDILQKLKNLTDNQNTVFINYDCRTTQEMRENIDTAKPNELVRAWINGTIIPWDRLHAGKNINIVTAPTYPFAKRRCWVTSQQNLSENKPLVSEQAESADLTDWLYHTQWEKQENNHITNHIDNNGHWLIFSDQELGFILQQELGKKNCTFCFSADFNEKLNEDTFYIDSKNYEHYLDLFSQIHLNRNDQLNGIIYLWPTLEENQQIDVNNKLLFLFKAIIQFQWANKIKFCLITRNAQAIDNDKTINIWQHQLGSITRIFASEQASYETLLLDLDKIKNLQRDVKLIAKEIHQFNSDENNIAYRDEDRYVIKLNHYYPFNTQKWIAPEAVIITGGLGALGSEIAKWLILEGTKHFLLIGHSVLPDRSVWQTIDDPQLIDKVATIQLLENHGAKVQYENVDVTNVIQLKESINRAETTWKKSIKGVFHLAGITTNSIKLNEMDQETLKKVFAAKVHGAMALHQIFNKPDLNCFVLFSSIAALPFFGMSGLSAYAMANEFIDGLSTYRQKLGLQSISINWAAWADKGMSHRYNHSAFLEAVGMSTIAIKKGIEILRYLLTIQEPNLIIFKIDWKKFLQVNSATKKLSFFTHFASSELATNKQATLTNHLNEEQIHDLVTNEFAKLLQLNITEIDPSASYQNYGLDSIIGINFVAALNEHFPDLISPMDLYKYPSIKQLVNYIAQTTLEKSETNTVQIQLENNDDAFLNKINHLNDDVISQMIEDELKELDKLL